MGCALIEAGKRLSLRREDDGQMDVERQVVIYEEYALRGIQRDRHMDEIGQPSFGLSRSIARSEWPASGN